MKKYIILFLVHLFNLNANAFTLSSNTSQLKGWKDDPIVYHLNPANCRADIGEIIQASMDMWNSISSSRLKLEIGTTTAATVAQAIALTTPETAVIVCDSAFGTTFTSDPNVTSGVGSSIYNSSFEIRRGYLVLNAQSGAIANFNNLNTNSAKIIMTHELGHTLGLGHSSDSSAMMHYTVGNKTEFTLSEDDINGMNYLYPRNELSADQFMGGCALVKSNTSLPPLLPSSRQIILFCAIFLMMATLWLQLRKKLSITRK